VALRRPHAARHTARHLAEAATLGALACLPAQAQQPGGDQPQGQAPAVTLPQVEIIGASPLLGSGVDRNAVPAETSVLTGNALTRGNTTTPDAVRSLNEQVGGVNLASASGNPYQPTFFYRGYQASPLQGTPQGVDVSLRCRTLR
jgi:iron complex outermembrane recepter protein